MSVKRRRIEVRSEMKSEVVCKAATRQPGARANQIAPRRARWVRLKHERQLNNITSHFIPHSFHKSPLHFRKNRRLSQTSTQHGYGRQITHTETSARADILLSSNVAELQEEVLGLRRTCESQSEDFRCLKEDFSRLQKICESLRIELDQARAYATGLEKGIKGSSKDQNDSDYEKVEEESEVGGVHIASEWMIMEAD